MARGQAVARVAGLAQLRNDRPARLVATERRIGGRCRTCPGYERGDGGGEENERASSARGL